MKVERKEQKRQNNIYSIQASTYILRIILNDAWMVKKDSRQIGD